MKEYVPKLIKKEPIILRDEVWGIGIFNDEESIGMTDGPFKNEDDVFECVGAKNSKIFHFFPDGKVEEIAKWGKDRWFIYNTPIQ